MEELKKTLCQEFTHLCVRVGVKGECEGKEVGREKKNHRLSSPCSDGVAATEER